MKKLQYKNTTKYDFENAYKDIFKKFGIQILGQT